MINSKLILRLESCDLTHLHRPRFDALLGAPSRVQAGRLRTAPSLREWSWFLKHGCEWTLCAHSHPCFRPMMRFRVSPLTACCPSGEKEMWDINELQ